MDNRPATTNTGLGPIVVAVLLAPGLLYVGIPIVAILTLFTVGLAAVDPLLAMVIPVGIGLSFAIGVAQPPESLDRLARLALAYIGGALALLAWLTSGAHDEAFDIGNPCLTGCTLDQWSAFSWLLFGPALAHAPLALIAAATGSRRFALAFVVSLLVFAAQVAFLWAAYRLLFDSSGFTAD